MLRNHRFVLLSSVILSLFSAGCSTRPIFKPRSEQIDEAQRKGSPVATIVEERAAFFKNEEDSKTKLLSLITARAQHTLEDSSYRIGPNDELEIAVFDVPELNVKAQVHESGLIVLPLVGAIKAVGLTEAELHDQLVKKVTTYVKNPQVVVTITTFGSQQVAVLGAVAKPGNYALKKGLNNVIEMITEAGGVTDRAGNFINFVPSEVSGISSSSAAEARAKLALASQDMLRGGTSASSGAIEIYLDKVLGTSGSIPVDIPVHGGDMIIVPEGGRVNVDGEIAHPGALEINKSSTLLGALAAAGGITYAAKIDEVEVIREISLEKKSRLVLDLMKIANGEERDIRLRSGDLIRVPSLGARRMSQDVYDTVTRVFNFAIGGNFKVIP